jgi:hypothetical protein
VLCHTCRSKFGNKPILRARLNGGASPAAFGEASMTQFRKLLARKALYASALGLAFGAAAFAGAAKAETRG